MANTRNKALQAFGLPPFEELLGAEFRERFDLQPAGQYAVACVEVRKPVEKLAAMRERWRA
jgi:hypothetical protein